MLYYISYYNLKISGYCPLPYKNIPTLSGIEVLQLRADDYIMEGAGIMSSVTEALKQSFRSESQNVFLLNEHQEIIWKNDAKLLDEVPSSYIDNIFNNFFINGAENLKFTYSDCVFFCNVIRIPDGSENIYVFQFSKRFCDNNDNLLPSIIKSICSSPVYIDSESYTSEATSIITNMFQSILFKCEQSECYDIIKYVEHGMKGLRMINRFNLLLKELFYCYSNNLNSGKNIISLSQTCESVINGCDDVLRESKLEFPCNIEDNIFVDIPSTHLKLFLILIILRLYRQNVNNKQFSVSLTKNNDYAIFLAKSSYESHDNKVENNNIDLLEGLEKYIVEGFCHKFNITLVDFKDETGCPNISLKIPVYKNNKNVSFKSTKRIYGSANNTKLHRILLCNIITDTLKI